MANILIVEDEPIAAWSIREALEAAGHKVVTEVISGTQAVQMATHSQPDLVLMDIRLADKTSGLDAAQAISSTLHIPVVFLTAYTDDVTIRQALETAPFGYVVKPFRRRELQASVDIAIQRHQREQGLVTAHDQLANTLESLGDAVITVDLEGRVTFLNPAAEHLTQWPQTEALGHPIEQVLPLFDQQFQPLPNPLQLALTSKQPQHLPDDCLLRTRQGSFRYVGDSATVIRNEAGQVLGGVLIFQDLTEHKQAEQTLCQRAHQERVLNTIATTIRQSLDLQNVLATTTREIRQLLEADRVLISQWELSLETLAASSVAPEYDLPVNISMAGIGLSGRVAKGQGGAIQVWTVSDIELAELSPAHRQKLRDFNVRAFLAIPINGHGNEFWGQLVVQYCAAPHAWQSWEVSMMYQLVLQLVLAIHHSQLYEKSQRQAQQAELLNQIVHKLRTSLKLSDILQHTVTGVLEAFQASRCVIRLGSPLVGGFANAVYSVSPGVDELQDSTMPICENPLMEMLFTRDCAIAIHDVTADPVLESLQPYFVRSRIRAVLTVAIRFQRHIRGVICLHQCDQPRNWHTDEVHLLEQVADQIAVAIDQAELYQNLKQANRELRRMAHLDGLTQVANRSAFDQYFATEFRRHKREGTPLCLIMCDVDYFKHYNDTYGHIRGDDCLKSIAQAIASVLKRPGDMAARYGGEEFAIVLPNTDLEGGLAMAKAIQTRVTSLAIPHQGVDRYAQITVSMGIASMETDSPTDLVKAADKALYQAKAQGRNCYCTAPPPEGL